MNNIQTFANYILSLAKEKKYDNVVVSFKNNNSDFSHQEIISNSFLIKSVIDAYRHLGRFEEAYQFLADFKIEIETTQDNYVLNSYGWLLYKELDEAIKKESSDQIEFISTRLLQFLTVIDISTSFYDMLIQRIIAKVLGVKLFNLEKCLELLLGILKKVKFRTEARIQQLIKNDTLIVGGISNVLGKSDKPERGFAFMDFLGFRIDDSTLSEEIFNAYGWLIYYQLKRDFKNVDDETPEEGLDTMFIDLDAQERPQLSGENDEEKTHNNLLKLLPRLSKESKYSPFTKVFNLYIKIQKSKASVNWQRILEFLNTIDYNELSTYCPTVTFIRKGNEKEAELASDKENWLSTCANALFRTKDFEKCLLISQTALETLERFHYNNDIWFARRIALCKMQIGDKTEAIQELEKIVLKKKEWFIEKELAELYFDDDRIELANKYALAAALNWGDKEKKDGLYLLLGKIYKKQKQLDLAYKHFQLALFFRQEQNFKVPLELKNALDEIKGVVNVQSYSNAVTLYNELLLFWKSQNNNNSSEKNNERLHGRITTLNKEKGFGFIKGDKDDFYFKIQSIKGDRDKASVGKNVSFAFRPSEPEKKAIAYDIKLT